LARDLVALSVQVFSFELQRFPIGLRATSIAAA
jgi:hypothetical protein